MLNKPLFYLAFFMLLCQSAQGQATLVSRVGDLYLYDPITFDGGILQRGLNVRGGAGTDQGDLQASIDLPFYQEFALQLGYNQRLQLDGPDANEFIWRFRMPVIELPRFGRISSYQFYYRGSTSLGPDENPTIPRHEFGGALALGVRTFLGYDSFHLQGGFAFRSTEQAQLENPAPADGGRFGIALRAAILGQVYEPKAGPGGQWSLAVSPIEVDYRHYGGRASDGGMTHFQLAFAGASVNFTPRLATYSLAMIPRWRVHTSPMGIERDWGFLANFSITYRTFLE